MFIKRDDLLEFHGVTGSKLRKFYSLLLDDSLRDSTHIVSYGGAQSNAMYALARLASFRGKKFVYFTRRTSSRLQSTPGNLKSALDVGMIHVQLDNDDFRHIFTDTAPAEIEPIIQTLLQEHSISAVQSSIVFIPQGGAWCGAEPGVSILAQELRTQLTHLRQHGLLAPKKPILFMPSGTGTTAFYLQKHVQDILSVVTVPISGDEKYLVKQMRWLEASHARDNHVLRSTVFPGILRPRLRASFADVRIEKLLIWKELSRSTNNEFEFDLIYAPKTWEEVMLAIEEGRIASNGEDLLYYHTGGIEGNVSMLGKQMWQHSASFFFTDCAYNSVQNDTTDSPYVSKCPCSHSSLFQIQIGSKERAS